jgi:hypothetical protein
MFAIRYSSSMSRSSGKQPVRKRINNLLTASATEFIDHRFNLDKQRVAKAALTGQ